MRLPLAANLTTRDGTLNKDTKLANAFVESAGQEAGVLKRPGLVNLGSIGSGLSQLLGVWDGQVRSVIDDTLIGVTVGQITPYQWARCIWNGAYFCAISGATDRKSAVSPDGLSWVDGNMPALDNWSGLAWSGSVFVATRTDATTLITNAAATSPDGLSWTTRTTPSSYGFSSVAWNGSVFCAVGPGLNANGTTVAMTSTNGTTWTERAMPSSQIWADIAWNGSLFIATSGKDAMPSTVCATSPDGITWTQRTLPTSGSWYRIVCGDEVSVMISTLTSSTNAALYSADGITWAASNLGTGYPWQTITWNGSAFVAAAGNIAP